MGGDAFDVDDLTNKVDVGSEPGTMWSLSSSKPAHGLVELRDPSNTKLWQSDGLLPHLINIQFARRTAVTHVSLFLNFAEDDSYTPNKIRIMAGTHFHDLVEVRTRELKEPSGWKHFVLDKFDDTNESDEEDLTADQSPSNSDDEEGRDDEQSNAFATAQTQRQKGKRRRPSVYVPVGVCKKHSPIYTYLVQISILSNHAAGKDTHIRGIRIFGPPTRASRELAKRNQEKARQEIPLKRRSGQSAVEDENLFLDGEPHIPTSRRLQVLSSVR